MLYVEIKNNTYFPIIADTKKIEQMESEQPKSIDSFFSFNKFNCFAGIYGGMQIPFGFCQGDVLQDPLQRII